MDFRSAHEAVKAARHYVREEGRCWVIDIDIKASFDAIDHDILMRKVAGRVKDKRVLKLIGMLHKIGVTGGDVKTRIANAKKDPTYLMADAEVVATFKLANINRKRLEALLHRFFNSARLDVELKDRFGFEVTPCEWFLVPLAVIEEAIQKLKAGTIGDYAFDTSSAQILKM